MSYRDDPNLNRRRTSGRSDNTLLWLIGTAAALLLVGLIAFSTTGNMTSNRSTTSSTGSAITGAPPATPPGETTGQATSPGGSTTPGTVRPDSTPGQAR